MSGELKTRSDGNSRHTSRVVARSQQDATSGLAYADDVAGGRCAEDAILADQQLLDSIGGTNLGNQLSNLWVPVATVTSNDEH